MHQSSFVCTDMWNDVKAEDYKIQRKSFAITVVSPDKNTHNKQLYETSISTLQSKLRAVNQVSYSLGRTLSVLSWNI